MTVELARTDDERARGLMYRRELAPEAGMLFLFSESEQRAFWMKNTLIPLDMLFIDDGGRVVGLVERAEPLTTSPRDPGRPQPLRARGERRLGGAPRRRGRATGSASRTCTR